MARKPFSELLDWFYRYCADSHALLVTKKGMIDVAIWTMRYVRGNSLPSTDCIDDHISQFVKDFITQHKILGNLNHFYSSKYLLPILHQRVKLIDDPEFMEKEERERAEEKRGGWRSIM